MNIIILGGGLVGVIGLAAVAGNICGNYLSDRIFRRQTRHLTYPGRDGRYEHVSCLRPGA